MTTATRFFLDTEFIEDGSTIELISIALVSSKGREFYAINRDCDLDRADPWVQQNVIAKLPPRTEPEWKHRWEIAAAVLAYVRAHPPEYEFWAYFADYDWVVFCQLFGRMIDLPKGFPMFCCDLKQEMKRQGILREHLPAIQNEHHALSDARWVKAVFESGVGHEWEQRLHVFPNTRCAKCGYVSTLHYRGETLLGCDQCHWERS